MKFSIVLIPDTQVTIQDYPEDAYSAADWINQNTSRLNIVAVVHVGDMIEWPRDADWARFSLMYDKIGPLPVSLTPGNHDFDHWNDQTSEIGAGRGDRSLDRFRRFFPISRLRGVVDSLPEGRSGNVAQEFTASGIKFLMISLAYWPTASELAWLEEMIEGHPDHKIIINTHDYMNSTELSQSGRNIWAVARRFKNVAMIFNGHWYPTAGHRVDEGDHGNSVYQVMADYQNYHSREPNSYIQVLTFDPSDLSLTVQTYSPALDKHMTGRANEFELFGVEFLAEATDEPAPGPQPTPEGKMRRYDGVQTGPVGESIIAFVERYYPKFNELYVTSAYRNEAGSHHSGLSWDASPTAAVDFGAYDGVGVEEGQRRMRDFAEWLDDAIRPELAELIHTTPYDTDEGFYVSHGRRTSFDPGTTAAHLNHVHVAFSEASLARAAAKMGPQTPIPTPDPTPAPSEPPTGLLEGLDYAFQRPPIAAMQAEGIKFVCRYLSQINHLTKPKILTRDEALGLNAAGIAVVSNFEWYPERCTEGFEAGREDAIVARDQARACGMPEGRPIYFSVDIDTSSGRISDYFRGILSVLPPGQVGVYGSYQICRDLDQLNLAEWLWQTYAWSGGQWYGDNHIEQYENNITVGGASADRNRSKKADFGQWFVDTPAPVPTPTPVPQPTPEPEDDELRLSDIVPSAATPDVPDRTLDQALGDIWRGVHWGIPILQEEIEELKERVDELQDAEVEPVPAPEPDPDPVPAPDPGPAVVATPEATKPSPFNPSVYAKAIVSSLGAAFATYTALKTGGMTAEEWQQVLVAGVGMLGLTWAVPNKTDKDV